MIICLRNTSRQYVNEAQIFFSCYEKKQMKRNPQNTKKETKLFSKAIRIDIPITFFSHSFMNAIQFKTNFIK